MLAKVWLIIFGGTSSASGSSGGAADELPYFLIFF